MVQISTSGECMLKDVAEDGTLTRLRGESNRAVVITSPPYATALPYIDTDRLSMIALGLCKAPALRRLEASLVGSREWNKSEQRRWDDLLSLNHSGLPDQVLSLCRIIQDSNGGSAGFRKRAVPSLLYRYFAQMSVVFGQLRAALHAGERAVFIVGVNRTGRGRDAIVIETPQLLGHVAAQSGFAIDELIRLETWPRYGLHHENGVAGESALVLTAS
jgi:site-specific DNA-methyltransferase (cytosine-N4-specific)